MVKSNCTQYCEVHDQAEFGSCINGDRNAAGNSSSTPAFYDVLCKSANASVTSVNGSGVGGVMGKSSFSVQRTLLCHSCHAIVG